MQTNNTLKESIGTRVRYERMKRNISIDELAEMLKLSPAFVGLIERGQRGAKLSNLIAIAEIFELSLDELILNKSASFTNSDAYNKEITSDYIMEKQSTLKSLIYPLSSDRLDFIIAVIRDLKLLEHENTE